MAVLADRWLLAVFLAGLGMGNHQTVVFLAPALALLYFTPFTTRRPPLWMMSLAFLAGLSIYGFLYFRAGHTPPLNAGDPDSWDRLWRVMSRADYGSMTLALGDAPPRDFLSTRLQLGRFVQGVADQVTWLGIALGVLGAGWGIWKRRPFITMLTIAFILVGPFFFVLGNLPFNAQSIGLLERFYMVPTFLWTILIVTGVWAMAYNARMISLMAFALPVFLMTREAAAFPARSDFRAYAYGQNNLRTLPPGALFIMDGGDDTFYTLAYLTLVENRRRDVTLHDRGGVVFPGLYGHDFRRLSRDEKEKRRQQIEQTLAASARPILFSTMNERIMPTSAFRLTGLLYGVPAQAVSDVFAFYDLRGIRPWQQADPQVAPDYRTRALLPYYAYQRSVQAAREARWDEAVGFSRCAYVIGPDVIWLIPNLIHNAYEWAQANFQAGRLDTAEALYRSVTRWDPKDAIAWSDLGAIEERRGRLDLAIEDYQTAIRIDPQSEAAHYNLAVAYWKKSDWPNVIQQLHRVLEINPNNAGARNYLQNAEARVR